MTANSIRSELAAATRIVNAAFARLPRSVQDGLDLSTDDIDRELDRALLADDRQRALRAISSWRDHNLATVRRAAR
jgi:hypothetical protein